MEERVRKYYVHLVSFMTNRNKEEECFHTCDQNIGEYLCLLKRVVLTLSHMMEQQNSSQNYNIYSCMESLHRKRRASGRAPAVQM